MDQQRLFRLAVENGAVNFAHEPGRGWRLSIALRRGDEAWGENDWDLYEGLSTQELLDTVAAVLDSAL